MEANDIPEERVDDYPADDYAAKGSAWHGVASPVNISNYIKMFKPLQNVVAIPAAESMAEMFERLQSAANGLEYQVMMPGGEAFFFKGLDIDSNADMYSHLTYRKGAAGAERK